MFISCSTFAWAQQNEDYLDSLFNKGYETLNTSPDKGLIYSEDLYILSEKAGNKTYQGYALYLKAEAYLAKSEFSLAIDYYNEALQAFTDLNDSMGMGCVYNGLGILNDEYEKYDESLFFYKKALDTDSSILEDVLTTKNNIARVYATVGNYSESKKYIKQVKIQSKIENDSASYFLADEIFADLLYYKENYKGALDIILNSINFWKRVNAKSTVANLYYYISDCYYSLGQLDKAYVELQKGRVIENEVTPNYTSDYYYIMEELIFRDKKDFEKAYAATVGYYNNNKRKKELDKTSTVELIKADFKFKAQLLEAEHEKHRLEEISNQKLEKEKDIKIYFLIAIIVAVSFAIFFVLNNIKAKKTNTKLELKNKQINDQVKELENQNVLREKLLGIIAHDSRSPLASISGALGLINTDSISEEEQNKLLLNLEQKTNSTLDSLNSVLSWSKAQMQGLVVDIKAINIKDVTAPLIANLNLEFSHKKVRFISKIGDRDFVLADVNLLKYSLKNLMINAAKFSHELGEVTLESEEKEQSLIIKIMDDGVGMTNEEKANLFQINTKSKMGTHFEKGTGLGLIQCKDFITKMNGSITIESEKQVGTTVLIELPKA